MLKVRLVRWPADHPDGSLRGGWWMLKKHNITHKQTSQVWATVTAHGEGMRRLPSLVIVFRYTYVLVYLMPVL